MFSTLEYRRNEFHKAMKKRDEIRQNLKENSLNNIKALHEKNNERIHRIISILQEEAKYLWNYCDTKYKAFDPMSTDTYCATMRHNIVICLDGDGKYENARLEFDIINHAKEDKFEVHSVYIHHDGIVYHFYERTFKPTANILDYADSIKLWNKTIAWLEGGVEDMFQFLTDVAKKDIDCLKSRTTI